MLAYDFDKSKLVLRGRLLGISFELRSGVARPSFLEGANRTPKARDHLGGSGGMHPRENFEI